MSSSCVCCLVRSSGMEMVSARFSGFLLAAWGRLVGDTSEVTRRKGRVSFLEAAACAVMSGGAVVVVAFAVAAVGAVVAAAVDANVACAGCTIGAIPGAGDAPRARGEPVMALNVLSGAEVNCKPAWTPDDAS